jgi:hypothetical protein
MHSLGFSTKRIIIVSFENDEKGLIPTFSEGEGHQNTALAFRNLRNESESSKMLNYDMKMMW